MQLQVVHLSYPNPLQAAQDQASTRASPYTIYKKKKITMWPFGHFTTQCRKLCIYCHWLIWSYIFVLEKLTFPRVDWHKTKPYPWPQVSSLDIYKSTLVATRLSSCPQFSILQHGPSLVADEFIIIPSGFSCFSIYIKIYQTISYIT